MPKRWLPFLIVGFAAIAVMFYETTPDQRSSAEEMPPATEFPHYFMEGVETVQFDAQGKLQYRFESPRVAHFQKLSDQTSPDDITRMAAPDFVFYQSARAPWHLTANWGVATTDGETVTLSGEVHAWQPKDKGSGAEILTPSLTLKPRREFAHTDKPVIIRSPNAHYQGDGMEADFQAETFTLLANVKGTHDPPSP